jgi:hypothetical protein
MKKVGFYVIFGLLFVTSVSFGALKDPTRPVEYSGPIVVDKNLKLVQY